MSNVAGIDLVTNGLQALRQDDPPKVNRDNTQAFNDLLTSAMNLYNETNMYQKKAEQAEINFEMGYSNSTHDLAAAQQKANIAIQYTVRVTNKVLDAYKELMNMQL